MNVPNTHQKRIVASGKVIFLPEHLFAISTRTRLNDYQRPAGRSHHPELISCADRPRLPPESLAGSVLLSERQENVRQKDEQTGRQPQGTTRQHPQHGRSAQADHDSNGLDPWVFTFPATMTGPNSRHVL